MTKMQTTTDLPAYEAPILVPLGELQRTTGGVCNEGSSDVFACQNGGSAPVQNCHAGNSARNSCDTGTGGSGPQNSPLIW